MWAHVQCVRTCIYVLKNHTYNYMYMYTVRSLLIEEDEGEGQDKRPERDSVVQLLEAEVHSNSMTHCACVQDCHSPSFT